MTKSSSTFHQLEPLLDFLEFSLENRQTILSETPFPLKVPLSLAKKMEKNNPNCPIFLQFVPLQSEKIIHANFSKEPVEDSRFRRSKKLLQKYPGRALLLVAKACAMHCRYCFRQNFSYETETKSFSEEISLLQQDPSLHEIILSGGDPLSLKNRALFQLLDALKEVAHLKIVRFHTRTPIAEPERLDAELIEYLKNYPKKIVFVLHVNHPKELDPNLVSILQTLKSSNVSLLSQSVLLKGVNDSVETLAALFFALFDAGILPYYLHQLDRVQGAIHFEVDRKKGISLLEQLRNLLPGYLIPRYVEEIAGQLSKTPITSETESLDPESKNRFQKH